MTTGSWASCTASSWARSEAGGLPLLAVSGEERLPGIDAPTLTEAGVVVTLENWRMVATTPDITEQAAIADDIEKMATSEAWKKALADPGWIDRHSAGLQRCSPPTSRRRRRS